MRAHQIMTRRVITVDTDVPVVDAANIMLEKHISGLPVLDRAGKLVGIVSQGDFIRRAEIGTERKRGRWLKLLVGPGRIASDFVHERGRKVEEIMSPDPITVTEDATLDQVVLLMERNNIKRLPVMRESQLVGIVTRTNLLQAVAGLARDVPDPTADDDHMRNRIVASIEHADWGPFGLGVVVSRGIVHLSGVIINQNCRQAAIVAAENVEGVKQVHDHLCWVDSMSGMYLNSQEDEQLLKAH
jgi:CBS domain-containing protein